MASIEFSAHVSASSTAFSRQLLKCILCMHYWVVFQASGIAQTSLLQLLLKGKLPTGDATDLSNELLQLTS